MSSEVVGKSLTYVETDLDVYRVTVFENDQVNSGTFPLNWSALGGQNFGVTPVASTVMPSGKAIEITKGAGDRLTLTWNAPPAIRDVSAVALLRSVSTPVNMGIGLRMSGASGAENCYFCRFSGNTNIEIFKIVAATATQLAISAFTHVAGENLWMRFDALDVAGGVLLRAKVWRGEMDDEPESFLVSFTETVNILAAAPHGLLVTGTNTPDFLCGLFRVRSMFNQANETLRYAVSTDYLPSDVVALPSLLEVQISPGSISLGENLGERATVTAAFKDHKHADLGELYDRGSYWGKFRNRRLFRKGQPIRVIRGLLGQALSSMETRLYVLDSFNGPSFSGAFQFVGKDPLKLADNDRALAPRPNTGFLVADFATNAVSFQLSPAGVGNAEYPSNGFVAVGGKEIMAYARAGIDSFVKAMLHFDGTDASTTITDSALTPHTYTATGNAQLDNADNFFPPTSLLCDGNGDFVSTPDSADFTVGSGNFTVDFWFRCTAVSGGGGNTKYLCGIADAGLSAAGSSFVVGRSVANTIAFSLSNGSSFTTIQSTTQFTNLLNAAWAHVAAVRSGNTLMLFINGTLEASIGFSGTVPDTGNPLVVGGRSSGTTVEGWQGWIDEFRFSVGTARWTDTFHPAGPYSTSGDVMGVGGGRAQFNTPLTAHQAEDRVQLCIIYTADSPADIINDLFVNYAGIPASYIPLSNWQTECSTFLSRLYTKQICEPTGVQELVSHLIEQAGLAVWWDSVLQQIKLQVLRGVSTDAFLYDQSNTVAGSISVTEQPEKQITQAWTYYGARNPLESLTEATNYRSGFVTVDLEEQTRTGGAVIKTIFADWIPPFGQSTASRINDLQIGRFSTAPRKVTFDVMRYSGVLEPQLGGGYRVGYWGAQTEYGSAAEIPIQVTRLNPLVDRFRVEAEEMLFTQLSAADLINRAITFDSNVRDVNLRSVHDSIYPAPTDADVVAGVNLTVTVVSGTVIGASNSSSPGFTVGSWPSGFLINIVVANGGRIAGAGGTGGDAGFIGSGGDGGKGGTALFTRKAITLNLSAGGKVFGGGGGGPGAGSFLGTAGGGGGGAGDVGGVPGFGDSDPPPGDGNFGAQPGTLDAGGVGGDPGNAGLGKGGTGGGPGLISGNGTNNSGGIPPGALGQPGTSIDGISFVTVTLGSGSILGPQIN